MVIVMTNPFWTMIMAWGLNGIRIRTFEVLAMATCFTGVCVIMSSKPEVSDLDHIDGA